MFAFGLELAFRLVEQRRNEEERKPMRPLQYMQISCEVVTEEAAEMEEEEDNEEEKKKKDWSSSTQKEGGEQAQGCKERGRKT
jgi:hypothetical protein